MSQNELIIILAVEVSSKRNVIMIKKILKIQLLGALFLSANLAANTQTNCEHLKGCKKKACHIQNDIAIAKKNENSSKEKGLQISLEKVNTYCSDEKLIEELQDKIKDTKKDLQEDTQDYEQALKDNKSSKIEKYKTKIAEENQKIKSLEEELQRLQ